MNAKAVLSFDSGYFEAFARRLFPPSVYAVFGHLGDSCFGYSVKPFDYLSRALCERVALRRLDLLRGIQYDLASDGFHDEVEVSSANRHMWR